MMFRSLGCSAGLDSSISFDDFAVRNIDLHPNIRLNISLCRTTTPSVIALFFIGILSLSSNVEENRRVTKDAAAQGMGRMG